MSGYLDDLSPAQAEALERLKAELPELLGELEGAAPSLWGVPLPGGRADKPDALDIALLKFLRADDFAYDAARERLRKCLVWRAAAQIDGIAAQDLGLGAAFAGHDDVRGADRDGRPLVISRFGTMDVETVFGDAERFLLWRVQLMERAVAELAAKCGDALSSPFVAQIPVSFLAATLASLASQPGDTLMSVINEGRSRAASGAKSAPRVSPRTESARDAVDGDAIDHRDGNDVATGTTGADRSSTPPPPRATFADADGRANASVRVLTKPGASSAAPGLAAETPSREETTSPGRRPGIAETATRLGFDGLYAGWQERLAHVAAVIVIQLVVYDDIKHALIR